MIYVRTGKSRRGLSRWGERDTYLIRCNALPYVDCAAKKMEAVRQRFVALDTLCYNGYSHILVRVAILGRGHAKDRYWNPGCCVTYSWGNMDTLLDPDVWKVGSVIPQLKVRKYSSNGESHRTICLLLTVTRYLSSIPIFYATPLRTEYCLNRTTFPVAIYRMNVV